MSDQFFRPRKPTEPVDSGKPVALGGPRYGKDYFGPWFASRMVPAAGPLRLRREDPLVFTRHMVAASMGQNIKQNVNSRHTFVTSSASQVPAEAITGTEQIQPAHSDGRHRQLAHVTAQRHRQLSCQW
jgi:hypothetical protein